MTIANKDLIRIFSVTTVFLFALWFLYLILPTLGMLAASLLIAVIMNPLTNRIQNFMPRKSRALAVVSTLLLVLLILSILLLIIAKPFVSQFGEMIDTFNESLKNLPSNSTFSTLYSNISNQLSSIENGSAVSMLQKFAETVTQGIKALVSSLGSFFYYFFTMLTLVFFMLFDSQKVIDSIGKIVPGKHQKLYHKLSTKLFDITARYFGGALVVAIIAGLCSFLAMSLLKIPYAVPLAVIIAFFDLIPMIGAFLGGAIAVIVTLLSGNVQGAIFLTIYLLIYQMLENNVIIPLVQKGAVKLSPLAVLVALLIGGAVGGIIGTLLAIPAAAFIRATYVILKEENYIKAQS